MLCTIVNLSIDIVLAILKFCYDQVITVAESCLSTPISTRRKELAAFYILQIISAVCKFWFFTFNHILHCYGCRFNCSHFIKNKESCREFDSVFTRCIKLTVWMHNHFIPSCTELKCIGAQFTYYIAFCVLYDSFLFTSRVCIYACTFVKCKQESAITIVSYSNCCFNRFNWIVNSEIYSCLLAVVCNHISSKHEVTCREFDMVRTILVDGLIKSKHHFLRLVIPVVFLVIRYNLCLFYNCSYKLTCHAIYLNL